MPHNASDHNLPSLVWTALIPVADVDPEGLVSMSTGCRLPDVLRWTAHWLQSNGPLLAKPTKFQVRDGKF